MQYEITAPAVLNHTVDLPSSKSVSNRALIIHALSGGGMLPQNLSDCDDTDVMIKALRDMPEVIDIKAAGTAMRFLTAYLAVTPGRHTITGTERMRHRPIRLLVDALRYLGAEVEYAGEEGYPPLRITGRPLDGGRIEIPGNVSSQYISALLMIGPVLRDGLRLHLTGDIISRPYIDMTLWIMGEFGAEAEWTDISTITVAPKPYAARGYNIENDWSAASYWYEMVALGGRDSEVTLTGLMDGSKQGDSSVRYIFSLLGVKTTFGTTEEGVPTTVRLSRNGHCVPRLEYDFINSPDLAQTFVVCCAALGVPFRFTGLQTLRIKETDRIEALKREMGKLGYVLRDVEGRELVWSGERCEPLPDAAVDTYDDHRMALAFAPLAMKWGRVRINNPHVVTKSYPHFWNDLKSSGFAIDIHE
ncbi:3-phosphoshikimate 1-carboxyvinyltransferase [Xylanibacter rodentium]|mgnify:CR=1 FL=1|uniref:3-phosphoshikimate 1-carboxyvinyltransferase n=1 Tax=Xylanibacter rodentium TaxID=2736289 RepID=UPI0015552E68|nr:3-phosphoshikimate 1-carboxyvinyltransferase [Xylanibacter rodentium]NPE12423.1 3-phosphoshikimate 1-carboxyvinyltransferase [Prevotella sp. PJ1A]NPE39543.1 3-phosphoshikimate 1-carboxyvinyltransferase [Prevotella sp. PCJ2]